MDVLIADRTYFIRGDGDDANDGLTEQTAIATFAKALELARALNFATYKLILDLGPSDFEQSLIVLNLPVGCNEINVVGQGWQSTTINGDGVTPGSIMVDEPVRFTISGCRITSTKHGLMGRVAGARIILGEDMCFGSCNNDFGSHMRAMNGAVFFVVNQDYFINGSAAYHMQSINNGVFDTLGAVAKFTGSPWGFLSAFASADNGGGVSLASWSRVGTCQGKKWTKSHSGWINAYGTNLDALLPGSINGG